MSQIMFILMCIICSFASRNSKVLTGIDCEAKTLDHPPFEYLKYGHAHERDMGGRVFQWECDGEGCYDSEGHKSKDWFACGYTYQYSLELDEMLDSSIVGEEEEKKKDSVLVNLGNNRCSPSSPCGVCQGDCDQDEDCEGSLECFKRDSSEVKIPGCSIGGADDIDTHDYCYQPKEYPPVKVIAVDDIKTSQRYPISNECTSRGMRMVSLQDSNHLKFLKREIQKQLDESYFSKAKGIALGYGYNGDHIFYDLNDANRDLTGIFHEAYIRGIITYNEADMSHGTNVVWVGFGWGGSTQIHDWTEENSHSAVICEVRPLGAGIWHNLLSSRKTVDADCPNKKCVNVDSLATCKRMCEEDDNCRVINFQKYGRPRYRCCLRRPDCDYTTATIDLQWDIFERNNIMPRVAVDVITRAWEDDFDDDTKHPCGDENPGYTRIGHWDATKGISWDSVGLGGRHYLVLCVKYGEWREARSNSFVSDFFVSSADNEEGIRIGATSVKGKDSSFEKAYGYRNKEIVDETMYFFITKNYGAIYSEGNGEGPSVHYIPGVPVGGWAILYSGNGAGDSHTFTSILTSTDETSTHEEQTEAYSKSVTKGGGMEMTAQHQWGLDGFGKSITIGGHWEYSDSKTKAVTEAVGNTITSSISEGSEITCIFESPDVGGAPITTWVWKTARRTYEGHITELQTCHTHVKVGPCRDQPPNCVPGYCKDQDCQDCLDETAKIDPEFTLRDACKDETDVLSCHASNFDGTQWSCCTKDNPCNMDEGDCDTNEDCIGDLVCVQDAGAGYGVSQYVDVCMTSRRDNNGIETGAYEVLEHYQNVILSFAIFGAICFIYCAAKAVHKSCFGTKIQPNEFRKIDDVEC